ncbi:MAG TPA: hypothetical protein VHY20_11335, partial [Pirellulales bacterium]|nr:hypothetical protein [Pirellulales bacterium]
SGATWLQTHEPRQGLAPYYNPLNERVQQAMLTVVRELAARYTRHESFAGLALQLSADGYAQLPGAEWGCDDDTLVRFTREVNLGDAAGPPHELRGRLLTPGVRRHWLRWRAEKLADLYGQMQSEIEAVHPGARLYLLGADMLNRPELLAALRPDLNKPPLLEEMLRWVGIETSLYAEDKAPRLVRVSRIGPQRSLAQQAAVLELNHSEELDRLAGSADLFFHEPQEARVASFDAKSPFRPTYTRLVSQPLPAGRENCRRFAHALATRDAQLMADGGWLLPLGGEDGVREFVQAYRELPPLPFQPVAGATQPVAIRTAQTDHRTYLYLVNDSPWPTRASLTVAGPGDAKVERLVGCENAPPASGDWSVQLKPYGLVSVTFSAPDVEFSRPRVELSPEAAKSLDVRVKELWSRAATLKHPEPKELLANGDFETAQAADGSLAGWMLSDRTVAKMATDDSQPQHGKQALRLAGTVGGVHLTSVAFAPPPTGRLSVSAWLRVADQQPAVPLRIVVQGLGPGQSYIRYASLTEGSTDGPVTDAWTRHVFQVRDLPEGLSGVSVHFELAAAGEVWIDDVRVFDLEFSDNERIELSKLIALAEYKRTSGEVSDCLRILEGYWPRFLSSYVPQSTIPLAEKPAKPAVEPDIEPAEVERRPGMLDRVRRLVPDWWR